MSHESYFPPETGATPKGGGSKPTATVRKRRRISLFLTICAGAAIAVLALLPSPYVIEQPGPVHNTLGVTEVDGKSVPVISVTGAETYKVTGQLNLLTVSLVGNPEATPNWVSVALTWFDPAKRVMPLEAFFPDTVTTEQRSEENRVLMANSQQTAIAAALNEQQIPFITRLTVGSVSSEGPSEGVLEVGDTITAVNGESVSTITRLRELLAQNGTEVPATISIVRDGVPQDALVTPTTLETDTGEKTVVAGIGVVDEYDFPVDIEMHLENVGGPSAGMMFALGIIAKMTPQNLPAGKNISGTGTITSDGTVGSIGGARQKLFAANEAGSTIFLLPRQNCADLGDGLPEGTEIFAVETLSDSMNVLNTLNRGEDTGSLPRCPANVE
ncbi:S16 family serine protease [Lysinibacter sp. HNR]|uniref:YlbL family protein n=1 Tax=Lysinibacter sp. HNR TaxID=3031408 RepID=UPI0024358E49|nr:S16 family serine protease [Lysinibacter sp. HNR]WGD38382.1 PDZ domain-containing protein [Lysinibacter sp. HNR]